MPRMQLLRVRPRGRGGIRPEPQFVLGDCIDILKTFPENHFHACVTDPPAGISFMGREWDGDRGGRRAWIAWLAEVLREVNRVLRPGAHAVVWALPRTSHWTATAAEDAGFEVRNRLTHIFGSGFPKSMDVSKAIDKAAGVDRQVVEKREYRSAFNSSGTHQAFEGETHSREVEFTIPTSDAAKEWSGWGTALKPAAEDWWLFRKPLSEKTVAANVLKWGTGALNIEACRITGRPSAPGTTPATLDKGRACYGRMARTSYEIPSGRWPANVIFTHDERCVLRGTKKVKSTGHYPDAAQDDTDRKKNTYALGFSSGRANVDTQIQEEEVEDWECVRFCPVRILDGQSGSSVSAGGRNTGVHRIAGDGMRKGLNDPSPTGYGDEGGASRFFYCAKADREERGPWNSHPTVKPVTLMEYLLKLVVPPDGIVLDPFVGSGTTCVAAMNLNIKSVGIDREEQYLEWAKRRCGILPRDPHHQQLHAFQEGTGEQKVSGRLIP